MNLRVAHYVEQLERWPESGRHILAQYDDDTIIVYQAYRPSIGRFAVENGWFGGDFKYTRMSWVKPNFLWMMYRSDWGRAEGQEVVLGLRLKRTFFDSLLRIAVPSSFHPAVFDSKELGKLLSSNPMFGCNGIPITRRLESLANAERFNLACVVKR